MNARNLVTTFIVIVSLAVACKSKTTVEVTTEEKTEMGATPVTITQPIVGAMMETVELNATSAFLLKTYVKSSANGYLQMVNAEMGRYVSQGQEMFIVKTKEAQSLGNTITRLDTSLHFDGTIHIKSPGTGYITQLNYRSGDYVQDGEQLATITDTRSFVFLLALPYELRSYVSANRQLQLRLPDSTILSGYVSMAMPTVDSVSQTQRYVIRVSSARQIPENLIAKVILVKRARGNAISVLKPAVLSDETQTSFWIMKMINDSTAVKVPVVKGMESGDKVEILSPPLRTTDRILLSGNYGLSDTARVSIIK
jgi:multidrug efflux pump subunit AcrA (membrane-fusion protein)